MCLINKTHRSVKMIKELLIDKDFERALPVLVHFEKDCLEESIIKEGCYDPIITWKGFIVDGHQRYEICKKNNISFTTTELNDKTVENKSDVILWIYRKHYAQRSLTKIQKMYFIGSNYNNLKMKHGGERKIGSKIELNTSERLGKIFNRSSTSVRKYAKVADTLEYVKSQDFELFKILMGIEYPISYVDIVNLKKCRNIEELKYNVNLIEHATYILRTKGKSPDNKVVSDKSKINDDRMKVCKSICSSVKKFPLKEKEAIEIIKTVLSNNKMFKSKNEITFKNDDGDVFVISLKREVKNTSYRSLKLASNQ